MRLLALLLLPVLGCANSTPPTNPLGIGSIDITINNCVSDKGTIRVALYDSKYTFSKPNKHITGKILPAQKNTPLQIQIPNLAHGEYAVAIYHDVNNNGELDKNMVGIPTEPYAFSNNPIVKMERPTFDDARFELTTSSKALTIELKYWKDY
jgi:uncharacterized protein (DUF2141 family)